MWAHKLGLKMADQVGSGYVDPTRPASIWTRPDPQNVKIFRTRPDPTRPDPRDDPNREQPWPLQLRNKNIISLCSWSGSVIYLVTQFSYMYTCSRICFSDNTDNYEHQKYARPTVLKVLRSRRLKGELLWPSKWPCGDLLFTQFFGFFCTSGIENHLIYM